jgi:hypothetical protein
MAAVLPKHGLVHAIFLLAYVARLAPRGDRETWLKAARDQSLFLAKAADFHWPVELMLRLGWARLEDPVWIDESISRLCATADRTTMMTIARRMLLRAPPAWLFAAASVDGLAREYIPADELADLQWIEPDLEGLLLEVASAVRANRQELRLKQIGDAAELYLMAALKRAGMGPTHAALWSDAIGYDIELPGPPLQRIEVKASSEGTRGRFRLTRNEFDKGKLYGIEWRVLQVVFANAAFIAPRVTAGHVLGVFELSADSIMRLAPADTDGFRWMESAQFEVPTDAWVAIPLAPDPDFSVPGFKI